MRPTLDHLPHQLWGLPLFGWGWVVFLVCGLLCVGLLLGGRSRKMALESIPFGILLCIIALFLLPNLEEAYTDAGGNEQQGIPIRGYGIMLFLGTIAGVWLGQLRARRHGIEADLIYSFATWLIACGLIGGRVFYVIQYWQDFRADTFWATLGEAMKVAQGGLVVYGALIGGGIAFFLFSQRHRVPMLLLSDIAAPAMLLGLAIGRIGCLLNGCCYGGLCDHPWAIRFPSESLVYAHQLANGSIHGFQWRKDEQGEVQISSVLKGSAAARAGLQSGDVVSQINGQPATSSLALLSPGVGDALSLTIEDGDLIEIATRPIPSTSQPVHPTQIYSAINASLVCALLFFAEPFLTRTGQLTALMLSVYPGTRFLLEMIRKDESAFWQTSMTISQNISVLLIMVAVVLWIYTASHPKGRLTADHSSGTTGGN